MVDPDNQAPNIRSTAVNLIAFTVFMLLLLAPWAAGLFGVESTSLENRSLVGFPELNSETLRRPSTFVTIGRYVQDRTPLRPQSIELLGRIGVYLNYPASSSVVFGPNDSMFFSRDFVAPCEADYDGDELVAAFDRWDVAAEESGKTWTFVIALDKADAMDPQLTGRAARAFECAREHWTEMTEDLSVFSEVVDLRPAFWAAEAKDPGSTYLATDGHWTAYGGVVAGSTILESVVPGLWNDDHVVVFDNVALRRGGIATLLGLDMPVEDHRRITERPGVTTENDIEDVGGKLTIRTYRSSGSAEFVNGTTVVVHDSMMRVTEALLAPYFEEIVFIHWDDQGRAGFFERLAAADHVVIESVGRSVDLRIGNDLLDENYLDDFVEALATRS